MSHEKKRHIRLLSSRDDGGDGRTHVEADEELHALLAQWRAPEAPPALDARLLASFRAEVRPRASLWQRALSTRISVPVPALAAAFLFFVVLPFAVAVRALVVRGKAPAQVTLPAPAPEVGPERIVEVPVVRERVVTRVVYVERERARRDEARSAPTTVPPAAHVAPDADPRPATQAEQSARAASMAGFKPVEDVKLTIIKGERTNR